MRYLLRISDLYDRNLTKMGLAVSLLYDMGIPAEDRCSSWGHDAGHFWCALPPQITRRSPLPAATAYMTTNKQLDTRIPFTLATATNIVLMALTG
jgi:hypothetical protein